jgi:septal ring factor EnvC (AmiA/AmiB activator)
VYAAIELSLNYELTPEDFPNRDFLARLIRVLTNVANESARTRSKTLASQEALDTLQRELAFRIQQTILFVLDELIRVHAETTARLDRNQAETNARFDRLEQLIQEQGDRISSQLAYGFRFDFDPTEDDAEGEAA